MARAPVRGAEGVKVAPTAQPSWHTHDAYSVAYWNSHHGSTGCFAWDHGVVVSANAVNEVVVGVRVGKEIGTTMVRVLVGEAVGIRVAPTAQPSWHTPDTYSVAYWNSYHVMMEAATVGVWIGEATGTAMVRVSVGDAVVIRVAPTAQPS
eukprot:8831253-Pyramimonas_sp.AAC.1